MYIFPPQNPDLKAERLMNYEISASQKLLNRALNFDLSLYYIDGSNSIQSVMVNNKPLNVNTGKIKTNGLEFATQYRIAHM
jgi:Outer membrane receptor proteins, mostly Fe transport